MTYVVYKAPGPGGCRPHYFVHDEETVWSIAYASRDDGWLICTILVSEVKKHWRFKDHPLPYGGPLYNTSWLDLLVTTGITKNYVLTGKFPTTMIGT